MTHHTVNTYGHNPHLQGRCKGDAREMQGSRQALSILNEYGKSMPGVWIRLALVLLMMVVGVGEMRGADVLPFTVSTASSKYYYKINIVVNSSNTNYVLGYYITPSSPYVSTSNVSSDDLIWYMMDANDDDTWGNKSFYFINAVSKEYLYYTGNNTNSVEMRSITDPSATADRFKFKVRRTQNSTQYIINTYGGSFGISPLELYNANTNLTGDAIDVKQSIFVVGNSTGGNNLSKNNSNAWGQQWIFESTSYVPPCETPTITYNNTTGNVTISSETEGATIYYTRSTSGSEPSAPSSSSYDGTGTTPIVISNVTTPTIYKAIAIKTDFENSEVATQAITQVETPAITLSDGKVLLSCATTGASIYYEIGNTADGVSTPTSSSTPYSAPIENADGKYIKAIAVKGGWINSAVATSSQISFPCATPVIKKATATTFTITCSFPTNGVSIYYTKGDNPADPNTSSTRYEGAVSFTASELPFKVKAIAVATNYENSEIATFEIIEGLTLDDDNYFIIASDDDFKKFITMADGADPDKKYKITDDINATGTSAVSQAFTGELKGVAKDDGTFPVISGLTVPIFTTATNATISNIILKSVSISKAGYVGAIACTANGTTRIYNCGILPTTNDHPKGVTRSTVSSTDSHCGSLVGYLDGYARVINCYSYANVSANSSAGGLVGYNTTPTTQGSNQTDFDTNVKTMVVNCMFYGDITAGITKRPVYGGTAIVNNANDKVNNYNYYCEEEASYDDNYTDISDYNFSWPVAIKHLTRFEVYRNILNSNRRLCTWWVNGTFKKDTDTDATDENVENVGIAKWVLDLAIAPYPILKKWGKYHSSFDMDPDYVWNPKTKRRVSRSTANPWEGKSYGTLSVTINGGSNNSSASTSKNIKITDMDTLGYDYCAKKIQLPYYNEVFGNPDGNTWATKYGNNYTTKVVTGWKVTAVTGGNPGTFTADWESGYNFADRNCTNKDLFSISGRVFAQGGYYYVPDGVTAITIEAYWGNAVYLCNSNRRLDKMNNGTSEFYVSGKLPEHVGGINSNPTVKTSLSDAIGALKTISASDSPGNTVYDQAMVLVGNFQDYSCHSSLTLANNKYDTDAKPFTIMSADFDFDNEPDFCFQAGMNDISRPKFQPIRFDFLMVPDITMAIRSGTNYWGIRNICPQGHYEVTETSFMYVTQFEYEERTDAIKHEAPMILNGGEFTQIVSTHTFTQANANATATARADKTSYFLMGGNLYMKAFTPGTHVNTRSATRHCAVNVIGGEFPEFYLSGMFRSDFYNMTDNPHAYLDGGWFGTVAGAGMESVGAKDETDGGNVTFKINHSRIHEFYGGGINANRPVTGNIDVTIDNSIVHKYCGGPKLGNMNSSKSITTRATGTTFDLFFGGGNGGTNILRENQCDGWNKTAPTKTDHSFWDSNAGNNNGGKFGAFTPFNYTENKGYQVEFEFELLPIPSGVNTTVPRTYYHYASFSKTIVAPITTTITDCTFKGNLYGGGNLGAVGGNVTTTIQGHTVVHGSVFGAGFSASIPSFPVHDKNLVNYAYRDFAGFIHDGSLDYMKYTTGDTIYYQWIHDVPSEWNISPAPTTGNANRYFEYPANSGRWYIYTTENLDGLGAVSGNVTLTIKGSTEVEGNVYGGGDESAVNNNTTVILQEEANILGNVFGGGNKAEVGGSATVNIEN